MPPWPGRRDRQAPVTRAADLLPPSTLPQPASAPACLACAWAAGTSERTGQGEFLVGTGTVLSAQEFVPERFVNLSGFIFKGRTQDFNRAFAVA